ncbi:MAG: D-glycerate dehydrogenase, partial [Anaerolineales bacterium]
MTHPNILITRFIPDAGLSLLRQHYPNFDIWTHDLPMTREELIQRSHGVDGLLCALTEKINAELMDSIGTQLKVISSMSVGVDHIDIQAATQRKIPVGNTPGVLTDATADQAFALMLAAARRITEA